MREHDTSCLARVGVTWPPRGCTCGADDFNAGYEAGRKAEREECAASVEFWADGQDRVALLKEDDAPCSAMSHAESSIIARRIAKAIRSRSSPSGGEKGKG